MNIFNTTISFLKRLRGRVHQDPDRDWFSVLTFSAIVFVSIIVWNIWAFDTVTSGGVIGAPVSQTPPVFNRSSLDAVHEVFINRADEKAKYETGVYRYADPSQ